MTTTKANLTEFEQQLVDKAIGAMENAYCKYSNFKVGAALVCDDGEIIIGANHENASYGATICAERSAIVTALTKGHRKFKYIVVATELEAPCSPCGVCRQVLIEFGDYKVILGSSTSDQIIETTTYELLPYAFTPKSLDDHEKETEERKHHNDHNNKE
ncbi:Cytidine deaminase [Caenorhabditis elegans]|uniref:Cytidine deaminase n=1 Tax=Caenorhabditis elegans TaxID=6239 RepID=Q22922_CAEEL|nr:Cytidine deaminase [Caenorhabditis elegans]CCD64989.1 Cytidine deaminase [Caenorhabditis elegans]|eukprot:NP_509384.1 Cytidine deaminase [Caenorhabditis elegans]